MGNKSFEKNANKVLIRGNPSTQSILFDSLCTIDELGNDDGMEGGGIGHSQTSPKEKCN